MTSPKFAFLWLSPLWRGAGPFLVQFKMPFTQGWFPPSFIEIGVLILEKIFFQYNICKYGFPYCGPSWPPEPWCEQFWIYIISESFHVNMTYSVSVFWRRKFFNEPTPFLHFFDNLPLWTGPGPLLEQFKNSCYLRMICTKFDWHWHAGSGEDICQYKHMTIWFSLVWSLPTPGTMMWTIVNLHYIRKLSCKYDLFWLNGSGEEDF
jgi:hypothetical protein